MKNHKNLEPEQVEALMSLLKARFEEYPDRHPGLFWEDIQKRLEKHPKKLWSLHEMEITGGEPDLISTGEKPGDLIFYDCAPESPKGRRSLCYDKEALATRKQNKPGGSAMEWANEMGIELLDEEHYRFLQKFGPFDTRTSSWLKTPEAIRELGGALFGDYRYGRVFIYHNGAESYYAARGFRGLLRI